MAEPTLIQMKTALAPDSIVAEGRLRPVSEAGVQAILGSVEELGQIVTPLVVRQRREKDGFVYDLLDGAHRLEAARRLGLDTAAVARDRRLARHHPAPGEWHVSDWRRGKPGR